jgi:hypothetical protein
VTSNLVIGRQQRIEDGDDPSRLRDEHTIQFVETATHNLEQIIGMIHQPDAAKARTALTLKSEIETLAAAACSTGSA